MKTQRKQINRLAARQDDWKRTMDDLPNATLAAGRPLSGVDKRIDSGGYHKPGSNKK